MGDPKGYGFWAVYVRKRCKFYTHWTDKGCVFHPGLELGIEHIFNNSIYVSLFITIYTTVDELESIYHMTIGTPLYRLL